MPIHHVGSRIRGFYRVATPGYSRKFRGLPRGLAAWRSGRLQLETGRLVTRPQHRTHPFGVSKPSTYLLAKKVKMTDELNFSSSVIPKLLFRRRKL